MKIEKVCTETYIFEVGDMFIFKQEVGCHNKGNFIILSGAACNYTWSMHTISTILGSSARASGGEEWLTDLLKSGKLEYIGAVEFKHK